VQTSCARRVITSKATVRLYSRTELTYTREIIRLVRPTYSPLSRVVGHFHGFNSNEVMNRWDPI
jgi:hypothetical protein